jgi:hypothetical protein
MDKLVCAPKGTDEEEMLRMVGSEVDRFVRNRWVEREWETAWFVNPPVGIQFVLRLSTYKLQFFQFREFKVFQTYLTFMSLHEGNLLKRSHAGNFKRSYRRVGIIRSYDRFVPDHAGTPNVAYI